MKLVHTTPCKECPWRKTSLQGYLGGHSPESYADALICNQVSACHLYDRGPTHPDTRFCAGALSTMANACILPDERGPGQAGAIAARRTVGNNPDTFDHPRTFYAYHAGEPYVPIFMRRPIP